MILYPSNIKPSCYREGLSLPPNLVRYCEPTGENILAAGQDSSLHIMNTVTETFNKSMGRASKNRKASKKKSKYAFFIMKIIATQTCPSHI